MPYCLHANGRCSICGEAMAPKDRRQCSVPQIRRKQKPTRLLTNECEHFRGAAVPSETVLVYGCRTCGRSRGVEATVCECGLHGRCVVFNRGTIRDKTITRCSECPDNTTKRIEQGD